MSENQDSKVSQLVDLGKKWKADCVEVTDGTDMQYTYRLKRMLRYRFEETLWGNENKEQRDAVVVSYWWD